MQKFTFGWVLLLLTFNSVGFAQIFSEQSQTIGFDHAFRARLLMGGGAAFFDYDNDGDEDLYVTGGYNKDDVFRNNGNGTFTKVLENIGIGVTLNYNTMGVTTGDIDNDGDRDVFIATWEKFAGIEQPDARSLLFLNNGNGTFTEIGEEAGITHKAFAMGAGFLDYNKDGYLDIYVLNHIREAFFTTDEEGAINGLAHDCYSNFLYLNNGDNTFSEVGNALRIDGDGCTIAAVSSDFDMDGDLDLYLANDFGYYLTPNVMYKNDHPNNLFTDVSEESKANVEAFGMGIAAGDFDHDLDFDYYTTNIGRNILIENNGNSFEDITTEAGVENATVPDEDNLNTTGWGTAFLDVDNDTWEDLYVANGRIPALPQYATATNDPDKLYLNNGDKTFADVTDQAGVGDIRYTHGMAYSDFDEDGDLDIVTVVLDELGGYSKFYVNETNNSNHYIQFKLIGTGSNRDAYGSKVWVYAGDQAFVKEIYGGGASHASQHTSILHFGLGDIAQVDSIRVDWTNGLSEQYGPFDADNRYEIVEGTLTNTYQLEAGLIDIIPNPFTDQFAIQFPAETTHEKVQLQLIGLDGRIFWQDQQNTSSVLELKVEHRIPSGMYFLHVQQGDKYFIKKVVRK